MNITLSNKVLDELDTSRIENIHPQMHQWFHLRSGQEHYRLLVYLATKCFDGVNISDIGTYKGASAVALAQNLKNKVFSLDIAVQKETISNENITFCIGNYRADSNIQKNILDSSFILLDVDHMYTNEIWLYKFLVDNNWKGSMMCDDIYLNNEMRQFWNEVSHPKIDITKYGHITGTGLINFSNELTFNLT